MLIVFGHRLFGRVDEHEGELAVTRFFHCFWLPIVPMQSWWLTNEHTKRGQPIAHHVRSIAAAYLRWWGPIGIVAAFAELPLAVAIPIAVVLAAGVALAWRWRRLPPSKQREADFNAKAFGTRCDPGLLSHVQHAQLRVLLDAAAEERKLSRPPEDVAKHGAADVREAVIAYGQLRLAAIAHGSTAERDAARRIVAGVSEPLPEDLTPYRTAATVEPTTEVPGADDKRERDEEIRARLASATAAAASKPPPPARWESDPQVHVAALSALTLAGLALAWFYALPALQPRTVGARELSRAQVGDVVTIDCTQVEPVRRNVVACTLPDASAQDAWATSARIAVIGPDENATSTQFTGTLERAQQGEAGSFPVMLDARDSVGARVAIGFSVLAVSLFGWGYFVNARRKKSAA